MYDCTCTHDKVNELFTFFLDFRVHFHDVLVRIHEVGVHGVLRVVCGSGSDATVTITFSLLAIWLVRG